MRRKVNYEINVGIHNDLVREYPDIDDQNRFVNYALAQALDPPPRDSELLAKLSTAQERVHHAEQLRNEAIEVQQRALNRAEAVIYALTGQMGLGYIEMPLDELLERIKPK